MSNVFIDFAGIVFIELIKAGAPGKALDLDFLWFVLL